MMSYIHNLDHILKQIENQILSHHFELKSCLKKTFIS